MHSENLKSKLQYCNVNIFKLLNFCDCRISNQQLYLCKILFLQKIDWTTCLYSIYSPVFLVRFSSCIRRGLWRKCSAKVKKGRRSELFCKKDVLDNSTKFHKTYVRVWHMCFPVNSSKILGTPFLQNIVSGELPLKMDVLQNSCSKENQTDFMIKIFEKYQWRSSILIDLQVYGL